MQFTRLSININCVFFCFFFEVWIDSNVILIYNVHSWEVSCLSSSLTLLIRVHKLRKLSLVIIVK